MLISMPLKYTTRGALPDVSDVHDLAQWMALRAITVMLFFLGQRFVLHINHWIVDSRELGRARVAFKEHSLLRFHCRWVHGGFKDDELGPYNLIPRPYEFIIEAYPLRAARLVSG